MKLNLYLKNIKASNFKNYSIINLNFSPSYNCLYGKNGSGKTNLIDLVYNLCLTKSYFSISDKHLIKHNENFYRIESDFYLDDENIEIIFTSGTNKKRKITKDEVLIENVSDYIGLFPVIFIAPDDISIIKAYSNERRTWLNRLLSQVNKKYLLALFQYNKALKNRNNYLKNNQLLESELIDYYNKLLVEHGKVIFEERVRFLNELESDFLKIHQSLTDSKDEVKFMYKSELKDNDLLKLLNESLNEDRILKRTTKGTHRDDIEFIINKTYNIKKLGSEGQQKSFLIALKLASANLIYRMTQKKPILLLDDIFDKLDNTRVAALIKLLNDENFGQVFITDTELERIEPIFKNIDADKKIFKVANGRVAVFN